MCFSFTAAIAADRTRTATGGAWGPPFRATVVVVVEKKKKKTHLTFFISSLLSLRFSPPALSFSWRAQWLRAPRRQGSTMRRQRSRASQVNKAGMRFQNPKCSRRPSRRRLTIECSTLFFHHLFHLHRLHGRRCRGMLPAADRRHQDEAPAGPRREVQR